MIKDKILLIGDEPGPKTDPLRALYPHTETGAAARLRDLMGWSTEQYLGRTIRLNANHDGQQKLTSAAAQKYVSGALGGFEGRLIIFVGRRAASRCSLVSRVAFGEVVEDSLARRLLVIPHTSGRNRFWNDAQETQRIRGLVLSELARARL